MSPAHFSPTSSRQQGDLSSMDMILIMGVTGAGKSYFINQLAGREVVAEGDNLGSCTQKCQLVESEIGGRKTFYVDTPGFDDTKRSAAEVLEEISKTLTFQYESGMRLRGIIYLHRISDVRYSGSDFRTFQILRNICGDGALKNVILVTNRWCDIDRMTGAKRENQLRNEFWSYMLDNGSVMSRFHGTRDSAVALVSQLLSKESVVLALQHEISQEDMRLDQTAAGAFVQNDLTRVKRERQRDLRELEKYKRELEECRADRATLQRFLSDVQRKQHEIHAATEQEEKLHQNIGQKMRARIESMDMTWAKILGTVGPIVSMVTAIIGLVNPD